MAWLSAARRTKASNARAQQSAVVSLPSCTGGLNARDGLTEMGPADAIILDNWFPEAQALVTRKGSAVWRTGLGSAVRTLLTWRSMTGNEKLFGAAGTNIFDVTTGGGGAVGAAVVAGLTNADWQWTNIKTTGGLFLIACNGADSALSFDGTSWAVPGISGVASSTFINVIVFKNRLWFVQANTLSLWYLPTQAIAGAATEFPLGAVFRLGGSVMAMGTYSKDSGDGPDDYLAIITTNGEVAVYEGTDPASSNTFSLSGIFTLARPVGRRCMQRLNGDLGIMTFDGVVSMQAATQFDRASDQKATVTGKIQTLFAATVDQFGTGFGWQLFLYSKARYYIVNYPVAVDAVQQQFVMNTVSGAWCTFSNLNAECWASANDLLFFGGNDGKVNQADVLEQDNGSQIVCDLQTAFHNFDIPQKKIATAFRPILLTGGGIDFQHAINWDFATTAPGGNVTAMPIVGGVWGSLVWAWTWGGRNIVDSQWHGGGGIGTWASIRFRLAANGAGAQLNAFNLLLQQGGPF